MPTAVASVATLDPAQKAGAVKQQNLLLKNLTKAANTEERKAAASDFAEALASAKHASLIAASVTDGIVALANDKKSAQAREAALLAAAALSESAPKAFEAHIVPKVLPIALDLYADKSADVRKAAEGAVLAIVNSTSPLAVRMLLEIAFENLKAESKWQTKLGALAILNAEADHAPMSVSACLPEIVPVVSTTLWETKKQVSTAANQTMLKVCSKIGNIDIEPHLPKLIDAISHPEKVSECIYALAAITFVSQVEAPALAIMTPLLERALGERLTAVKRQAAVIIDNMCKLVENPRDIEQFLPKLLPGLQNIVEHHADPECRGVAQRAVDTLTHVGGEAAKIKAASISGVDSSTPRDVVLNLLQKVIASEKVQTGVEDSDLAPALEYVAGLATFLIERREVESSIWENDAVSPYLLPFYGKPASISKIASNFLTLALEDMERRKPKEKITDDDEGEVICNTEFSLAYGGMILLNNTRMRLVRGRRYGLCGPNGCGKSTLLRAIANGQLEGFPPQDELKTIFVEHSLQASEAETAVVEFVVSDPEFASLARNEIVETLASVGFNDTMQAQPVSSLSGGWRMKLELARAMLRHADILLLDEPTNHLDVANVKWLEDYLTSLDHVTSIIVSHDSGFLDNICTHVIHYEHRKLVTYKGNLAEFVKQKPEARTYYELDATPQTWKFPAPGFLEGIKSRDKAILKMKDVTFSYPGTTKQALSGISVQVSLSSRIAVLGPNGAGKSTLIKLLTGEMNATTGDVWKHPNLRFAYVAQHAFHHVEQHLDKTPNQYVQWRFHGGEDREMLAKESRQISEEEKKQMAKQIVINGEKRVIEMLMSRRKMKQGYEYEVKFVGLDWEKNEWLPRDDLEKWGFTKLLQRFDDREAALAGVYKRTLSAKNIQKHFEDLGLDSEFAMHSRIRGLSGGQKVKVVLGAALWLQPHIIVMDEPTNFLDRESLGALSAAIAEYQGGVVIISHNREFTGSVCPEVWKVEAGVLTANGVSSAVPEKIEQKQEDTMIDAFGNVEKVKVKKKLTRKELKAREKKRKEAAKMGLELSDDDDDFE